MPSLVQSKYSLLLLVFVALAWSFWVSPGWLQLCAGLALFLFGMQNLEHGLKNLAGGQMEALMARSTATPVRGLLFGTVATFILQSSTLVSLLIIAFLSAGMLTLTGGIAILLGANLGATSGIWLLALAGQNLSMAPLAMPLLVFGVLLGFFGNKSRAIGLFLLGISLIFLGIDQIKVGFSTFGDLQLSQYSAEGMAGALLFIGIGTLITVVVQSSHATLMLTLAALGSGHLDLPQSLAIAIGSNLGSALSTGVMGMIGSARTGQRLAVAHVVFNTWTSIVAFVLLVPLTWFVIQATGLFGAGENKLIQLALFHTIFNAMGVLMFWSWQDKLAALLVRWLPDKAEPQVLTEANVHDAHGQPVRGVGAATHARYLEASALQTAESARRAVARELQHMGRLALEVVAQALYSPPAHLHDPDHYDRDQLQERITHQALNANALYKAHLKPVYAELLQFMGRAAPPVDADQQAFWRQSQVAAFELVEAVKEARRLQRGLYECLKDHTQDDDPMRQGYLQLRQHVLRTLAEMSALSRSSAPAHEWAAQLQALDERNAAFEDAARAELFAAIRAGDVDGLVAGSLMNDLGSAQNIIERLHHVLLLGEGREAALADQLQMGDGPLIDFDDDINNDDDNTSAPR